MFLVICNFVAVFCSLGHLLLPAAGNALPLWHSYLVNRQFVLSFTDWFLVKSPELVVGQYTKDFISLPQLTPPRLFSFIFLHPHHLGTLLIVKTVSS